MKKLIHTIIFLALGYMLPLMFNPALLLDPKMLSLMLACIIVFLTQPTFHVEEGLQQREADKSSVFLILVFSVISVAFPIVEWAYFSYYTGNLIWIGLGGTFILGGVFIRVWAIQTLGKYFTATVQISDDHQLVKNGPYQIVRHPSYLGAYMVFIGSAILLEAWLGGLIAAIIMIYVYHLRITAEEESLVKAFGKKYLDYRLHTQRLIPYLW